MGQKGLNRAFHGLRRMYSRIERMRATKELRREEAAQYDALDESQTTLPNPDVTDSGQIKRFTDRYRRVTEP